MTSYLIDDFARRASTQPYTSHNLDQSCAFCQIISDQATSHKIYEDEHSIAILDIQPIRRGHALVIPKVHVKRLSDLSPELAAALGVAVSRVANAICRGKSRLCTTTGPDAEQKKKLARCRLSS
jgi:diadenosine tetraphosphate (Ap4A) HIT family hydrolase